MTSPLTSSSDLPSVKTTVRCGLSGRLPVSGENLCFIAKSSAAPVNVPVPLYEMSITACKEFRKTWKRLAAQVVVFSHPG